MKQFKGGDRPGKRVPFNRAKLLNIGNGLLSGIHGPGIRGQSNVVIRAAPCRTGSRVIKLSAKA